MITQHQHPGVKGAGNGRGQHTRTGHDFMAQVFHERDIQAGRGGALAANGLLLPGAGAMEQNGAITARPVQMRFHDLQREAGGSRGIKSIAAAFQYRHPHLGSDPMGGGHRPEGADDFRPRGEGPRPFLCRKADGGKGGLGHGRFCSVSRPGGVLNRPNRF